MLEPPSPPVGDIDSAAPITALPTLPTDSYVDPQEIISRRGNEIHDRILPGNDCLLKNGFAEIDWETGSMLFHATPGGAWALYEFPDMLVDDQPLFFDTTLGEDYLPDGFGIGISDYGNGRWNWIYDEVPAVENAISFPDGLAAFSPGGSIYVIVIAIGTETTVLEELGLYIDTGQLPPPRGLIASQAMDESFIQLTWDDPALTYGIDYDQIRVERTLDRRGPWKTLQTVNAGEIYCYNLVDGYADPGQKVYYRLRTIQAGQSGWQSPAVPGWTIIDPVQVAPIPSNYFDYIEFHWEPVPHADGYEIEYSWDDMFYENEYLPLVTINDGAASSFRHSANTPEGRGCLDVTEYRYRIWTLAGETRSATFSHASGRCILSAVRGLTATDGFTDQYVEVSWLPAQDAAGYIVEYREHDEAAPRQWLRLQALPGAQNSSFRHRSYSDGGKGCDFNVEYDYAVRMVLDWRLSDRSPAVAGRRALPPVKYFSASDNVSGYIKVDWVWSELLSVNGVVIDYRNLSGGEPAGWTRLTEVSHQPGNYSSYHHNVPEGEDYGYRIANYRETPVGTELIWSDEVIGRRGTHDFALIQLGQHEQGSTEDVRFLWNYDDPQLVLFRVYYRNAEGGLPVEWQLLAEQEPGNRYFIHTADDPPGMGCEFNTWYEYYVDAVFVTGKTASSDILRAGRIIPLVTSFDATQACHSDMVELTWDGIALIDVYRIEYRSTSGHGPADWQLLADYPSTEPYLVEHSPVSPPGHELDVAGVYKYRIRASAAGHDGPDWVYQTGYAGVGPGDWSMSGHDAGNSRRSIHVGPESPVFQELFGPHISSFHYPGPVFGWDGSMYFGNSDGMTALDADGELKWQVELSGGGSTPALGADGTVYCRSHWGPVHAISPAGELLWTFETGDHIYGVPILANDGTLYTGCDDGNLYALNPNGTLSFSWQSGAQIRCTPALLPDGAVVFTNGHNYLCAVNPDGTERFKTFINAAVTGSSPAVAPDGTIYFGTETSFKAFNPDGTQKWMFGDWQIGKIYNSPAIAADGMVCFGSDNGWFYALNPDGTERWTFLTADTIYSSPAIDADGRIYFGSHDKRFYALEADGSFAWSYYHHTLVSGNVTISPTGQVYFLTLGHLLIASEAE